jgi:hypothetical protein
VWLLEEAGHMVKPPPPEPPPMRQLKGPYGVETEASKRATEDWRRRSNAWLKQNKERAGVPPTTEWKVSDHSTPYGWTPGDPWPPYKEPEPPMTLSQVIKRFHMLAMVFWACMIYPTIFYWSESVPYLVFLSIYTIIIDHAGAWATARIERNAEKEKQDERT